MRGGTENTDLDCLKGCGGGQECGNAITSLLGAPSLMCCNSFELVICCDRDLLIVCVLNDR